MLTCDLVQLVSGLTFQPMNFDKVVGRLLGAVRELRGQFLACFIVIAVEIIALPSYPFQQRFRAHIHAVKQCCRKLL
jgi:hypothetical protein